MFSYSVLKRFNQVTKQCVRYKNPPDHWSVLRKKVHPTDKALAHFDDFYKQIFQKQWPTIRQGLLGKQKYVAVINNYGDNDSAMAKLELQGALNVRTLFHLEKGYIGEELERKQRNAFLEKIWKNAENTEGATESQLDQPKPTKQQYSLESSLATAEIDERRLVDSSNALSSEILNEFIPATQLKGKEGFVYESDYYKMYDPSSHFEVKVQPEYDIHFPDNLNVYCFEEDNHTDFRAAATASTGVLNYYLMDGGSLLPVLALDLRPGCTLLDLCASPGGKTLLALQTLYPQRVVSNDVSMSRVNRIEKVYKQFLYDLEDRWLRTGRVALSNVDGRSLVAPEGFDRVLVDVPCTTDRHSLKENDNNIFKPSRIKERLKLPELQSELLFNALKLVKPGGVVVYSTCTLSPIQNDGVVNMALKKVWEETSLDFVIKDLSVPLVQTRRVYKLAEPHLLKYGHLVLPCKKQNYGPTYFCKLQRIK